MQVKTINLHGSASKPNGKAQQRQSSLSLIKADVITEVARFEPAKMQDKGEIFGLDGNKPYLL